MPVGPGGAGAGARVAALAALMVLLAAGAARAEEQAEADPRRAVAVLAFRAGASELPGIDRRVAELLRAKTSLAILDMDDARRRYGGALDGNVADCAGDHGCMAGIGRRLQADEVLLVGISRFGDVILTLQRIDVAQRSVRARIADALPPGAAPDADALLAYLRRVMPRSDFLRFGVIRIQASLRGAAVLVGGEPQGHTPIEPLRVRAPDRYDIRITKDGYVPFTAETTVPPDGEVVVRAVLSRREKPWYKRWWVWAAVGAAAVAGTTAAVLIMDDDRLSVGIRFGD